MGAPIHITFTGIDEHTNVGDMIKLSAAYPVEFGLLFSASRQGEDQRYPVLDHVLPKVDYAVKAGVRFSAHICGRYSREAMNRGQTEIDRLLTSRFRRVQVNTAELDVPIRRINRWARGVIMAEPIMQTRGFFPETSQVVWLFDASGGRGFRPPAWPKPRSRTRWCGYAGGLGPDNVASEVEWISQYSDNFWIDMESSVRDGSDWFDIERARAVCRAVYGERRWVP